MFSRASTKLEIPSSAGGTGATAIGFLNGDFIVNALKHYLAADAIGSGIFAPSEPERAASRSSDA